MYVCVLFETYLFVSKSLKQLEELSLYNLTSLLQEYMQPIWASLLKMYGVASPIAYRIGNSTHIEKLISTSNHYLCSYPSYPTFHFTTYASHKCILVIEAIFIWLDVDSVCFWTIALWSAQGNVYLNRNGNFCRGT